MTGQQRVDCEGCPFRADGVGPLLASLLEIGHEMWHVHEVLRYEYSRSAGAWVRVDRQTADVEDGGQA